MDQSWSVRTENIPYRLPKEWLNGSRSRGWRRSTATLWWCEIHGHGAGCSLADVHRPDECFFTKIHQKGHISKRQEGTNRQAWNMTNVRMKVQRSSLTTLHWPPWRVLAINLQKISFVALHWHAFHLLKLTRSFLNQFQWFSSFERKPKRPNSWTNSWRLDSSRTFAFPALQAGKVPIGHLPWRFFMRCTVKRSCPTGPGSQLWSPCKILTKMFVS